MTTVTVLMVMLSIMVMLLNLVMQFTMVMVILLVVQVMMVVLNKMTNLVTTCPELTMIMPSMANHLRMVPHGAHGCTWLRKVSYGCA